MNYTPTEQELSAIALLQKEKTNWEDAHVYVTDKVGFKMIETVKNSRKNYFGIFDEPLDPITRRRKIFIPLTEWTVETVLKNIDIDTSDIKCYPRKPSASRSAGIFRYILKSLLDSVRFGITLNTALRNCVIDGTAIFKVWRDGKNLQIKVVDRLNLITDPSTPSLDESPVIERNLLSLPELREYKDEWENIELVEGVDHIDRIGTNGVWSNVNTEIPYVEVYERYGHFEKYILTGKDEDRGEYTYGLIVVSGLNDEPVVHKVKEVKHHPYQEIKFKEVLNRFDGRGIPEMLAAIQAYVNEIVNIRLNSSRIAQTNLWRVGSSVTPQQLQNLFVTGAIKAQQGEIENISSGTVDPSSYRDEDMGYQWAQRVTQSSNEDEVAASKPATNALIEERGANKAYGLIIEGILMAIGKMIEEKIVPMIPNLLNEEDVVKITGDPADLEALAEPFVRNMVRNQYEAHFNNTAQPLYASQEEEDALVKQELANLAKNGDIRFVEYVKEAFDTDYEITVDPAGDEVNRGVMVKQLTDAAATLGSLGVPPTELKDVFKEIFDGLGLSGDKLVEKIQAQPQVAMDTSLATQGMAPVESNMVPQPSESAPTL